MDHIILGINTSSSCILVPNAWSFGRSTFFYLISLELKVVFVAKCFKTFLVDWQRRWKNLLLLKACILLQLIPVNKYSLLLLSNSTRSTVNGETEAQSLEMNEKNGNII